MFLAAVTDPIARGFPREGGVYSTHAPESPGNLSGCFSMMVLDEAHMLRIPIPKPPKRCDGLERLSISS
jgi:hypothetical protein